MSGFYPDKSKGIEILDDQNKLSALWNKLNGLNRINVSTPLDIETSAVVTSSNVDLDRIEGIRGKPATEVKAVGLEKGKLIAVRDDGGYENQWQTFHLLRLKKDGRFAVEFPLSDSPLELDWAEKPIVVYPDDDQFKTVRLRKTPEGFKLDFSSPKHDPAYTKDRNEYYLICKTDEEFFSLDQNTADQATSLTNELTK